VVQAATASATRLYYGPQRKSESCPAHVPHYPTEKMQGVLARAVRQARVPAGSILLRPLSASNSIPKLQPFARCFATSGKGKKVVVTKAPPTVASQLIKKLNDEVMYEIKNYESPPSIEHGPPKGWEKVSEPPAIHKLLNLTDALRLG
jgi:hypothetical protein